jgi:hypothetical protein
LQNKFAIIAAAAALLCAPLATPAQAQTSVTITAAYQAGLYAPPAGGWGYWVTPPYLSPCTWDAPCTIPRGVWYGQTNLGGPRVVNGMCWVESADACAGLCQKGFGIWRRCEVVQAVKALAPAAGSRR